MKGVGERGCLVVLVGFFFFSVFLSWFDFWLGVFVGECGGVLIFLLFNTTIQHAT